MQELTKLQPLFTELRPLLPSSERFPFAATCRHGEQFVIDIGTLLAALVGLNFVLVSSTASSRRLPSTFNKSAYTAIGNAFSCVFNRASITVYNAVRYAGDK